MKKNIIPVGTRWARLVFIGTETYMRKKRFLKVKCDCGTYLFVEMYKLKTGHTKSCGCYMMQRAKEANTIHGHAKKGKISKTYKTWIEMLARCNNKNNHKYSSYGGRGITVSKSWLSFKNFFKDMGERPVNKTLDRINNDGNYTKNNCRWASASEQSRNTRRNIFLTFNNKTQCLRDWAKELNLNEGTLLSRKKKGWTTTEVLNSQSRKGSRKISEYQIH